MKIMPRTWILRFAVGIAVLRLTSFVAAAIPAPPQSQAPINCKGALTVGGLLGLVDKDSNVPENRVIAFIDKCGVDFQVTGAVETQLKAAGATPSEIGRARAKAPKVPSPLSPIETKNAAELNLWNSIKEEGGLEQFEEYLRLYPQSQFAPDARVKIRKLNELALGQQIAREIGAHRWDAAELLITDMLKVTPVTDQIRTWQKNIVDGREAIRKAAELTAQIEREIGGRQWDAAERLVAEILKVSPGADQVKTWQKEIADGRDADRRETQSTALRQQTGVEIGGRRWDAAERLIAEMLKLTPATDQIRTWQKDVANGRDADRRAAEGITLENNDLLDFETAAKSAKQVDLMWVERNRVQYLIPQGQARILILTSVNSFNSIGVSELRRLNYPEANVAIDTTRQRLVSGMVMAVRTSEGNYVKAEVLRAIGQSLRIRWMVYR